MSAEDPNEPSTVLGVVPAPSAEGKEPSEYEEALTRVSDGLARVRQRLTDLRAEREAINDEVRRLVEEATLLERMSRVTPTPPKPSS